MKFEDECIGSEQHKYSYLVNRKQISKEWTPIFTQKRSFLIKSVWVTCVQYPLRHAAARTIHIAQSATFKNIYIDMDTNTNPPKHWWQHMHYVALSRVTSLSGLYLKSLNSDKICVSPDVLNYVEKAKEKYKLKLSYTPLYMYSDNRLKVVYNNSRSYKKHYMDMKNNHNILAVDVILLSES